MTFSHDGLRDSLTHLAAPPYFYENLRRELTSATRNESSLTLVRFQLFSNADSHVISDQDSKYEIAIISFAELIKSATRAEDLCARLGKFEFTLILKAPIEVGMLLSLRVSKSWNSENFLCQSALVQAQRGENSLEILNRLDSQELFRYTP
jgi:hypothetical protein